MLDLVSKKEQVKKELASLKAQGVFSFVAETTKKALKKSRITKITTPDNLTEIKKVVYNTVSLGNDYQKAVNNRLAKEGKAQNFQSEGTYCEPVSDNKILYKHKEREEYYLRVYPNLCVSFKRVTKYFDKNGVEINKTDWDIIEAEYFPLPSPNEKQGLDNPIIVNNYKIDNVKYLKRGDFIYNELTQELLDKLAA
jgi:hypothetical protein